MRGMEHAHGADAADPDHTLIACYSHDWGSAEKRTCGVARRMEFRTLTAYSGRSFGTSSPSCGYMAEAR